MKSPRIYVFLNYEQQTVPTIVKNENSVIILGYGAAGQLCWKYREFPVDFAVGICYNELGLIERSIGLVAGSPRGRTVAMFQKDRILRHMLRCGIAIAGMAALTAALITASVLSEPFASRFYVPFSRSVSGWAGALYSFTSFSAAELFLYLLAIALPAYLAAAAVFSLRHLHAWALLRWLSDAALCFAAAVFLFFLLWGCNYFAPKLETRISLQTEPQPEEILYETARFHLEQVLQYADTVPRDQTGMVDAGGFSVLAPKAVQSILSLEEVYPELISGAHISPPKRVLAVPVMSALRLSGIYSPFTGECNVNTVSTDPFLPFVMCHEMAHRLSFAPEDDANMVAYLACINSEYDVFRYSGALLAFGYCRDALADSGLRSALWEELPPSVREDYAREREAWVKYENPAAGKIAAAFNDGYLQAMRQPEGIRSYGRVVDLLIALYLQGKS